MDQPPWQLPITTGLAVGVGMQLDHPLEERRLGSHDVLDRLPRHRLGQEADEITRMAGPHRDADLAVGLEPADRPMAGTRVDDDERPLLLIDDDAGRRGDADQPIVRRPRQLATVHHELALEVEHMRCLLGHMLMVLIAALAQDVEEQDAALPRVHSVVEASGPGCMLAATDVSCSVFVMIFLRRPAPSVDDVVATVDVNRLAGDQLGSVGGEIGGGHADVVDRDQALHRRLLLRFAQKLVKVADARGGAGLERPRRDRMHPDALGAELGRQVTRGALGAAFTGPIRL